MATASLEIHQVNVGQGDAVLIIHRDAAQLQGMCARAGWAGTDPLDCLPFAIAYNQTAAVPIDLKATVKQAVLVDGGDDEYGGDVVNYLERHGVVDPAQPSASKLTVVATHYHDDHIAGLRSVFKKKVLTKVVVPSKKRKLTPPKTATKETYEQRYYPAHVYCTEPDKKADPKPPAERLAMFRKDVEEAVASGTRLHYVLPGGQEKGKKGAFSIELGQGAAGLPIRLVALAASQTVRIGKRFESIPAVGNARNQNERSIVYVLEYGGFRYFLGGDIAGNGTELGGNGVHAMDPNKKSLFSLYADVETSVGQALEKAFPGKAHAGDPPHGHCCVFKANHHASSSSVDVYLLATLQPKVAVITSGVKARFHGHPTPEVLGRMKAAQWFCRPGDPTKPPGTGTPTRNNTIEGIYITEVAQCYKGTLFLPDKPGSPSPLDETDIMGDVVIRPTDESVRGLANGTAAAIELQVYGTGELTGLVAGTTALRAATPTQTPTAPYPIGPYLHECDKH